MLGEPHDAKPHDFLNSRYRYFDYEFERYWAFYRVFGRLSYNPETRRGRMGAGICGAIRRRGRAPRDEGRATGEPGAAAGSWRPVSRTACFPPPPAGRK